MNTVMRHLVIPPLLFAGALILGFSTWIDPDIARGRAPQSPIHVTISLPEDMSFNSASLVTCSVSTSSRSFGPLSLRIEVPWQVRIIGPTDVVIDTLPADTLIVRTFPVIIDDTGSFEIAACVGTLNESVSNRGDCGIIYVSADRQSIKLSKSYTVSHPERRHPSDTLSREEIKALPKAIPK